MKVLITGASGFIGSRLLAAACATYGSENVTAFSSLANAECYTIVYNGDELRIDSAGLVRIRAVEVVIHAGAYTPKSSADANVSLGCTANISFTQRLLELPFSSLKQIIYLSSLDVYAPAEPITEETLTLPPTLYGLSKLYCERMVALCAAERNITHQILRLGHVYGPGEEKYGKFLPKAIADILGHDSVELWGDGAELRSLIYIDDVVESVLASIGLPAGVGVINVVGSCAISIRQLLDQLIAVSAKRVELVAMEFDGPRRNYVFDNTKLKSYLLTHETDLSSGLRAEYDHMAKLQ
ncbi:NAD(P)-dependent oxidoreductase [Cryobacterium sp. TMS1-20-1]|uniref:NAD-dependent epimerase/dehydratase family protein n=1 Tax=Cryobacterium sp. TMS1-20-1 TaxID=1259223 RepID=UPI00106AFBDB|nr:NAD(P)-dependent oxidoreductase [Cryobacterium sp. TMS1-20-1]TFC70748.1 NAD(P)-dependent oxidoreductase [Cryobacterium sp. TMS1-20-1]